MGQRRQQPSHVNVGIKDPYTTNARRQYLLLLRSTTSTVHEFKGAVHGCPKRTWRIIIVHARRKLPHVALWSQWSQRLILVGSFKIKTLIPVQRSCQADSLCLSASNSGQTRRWQRNKWRFGVELRGGTMTPMLPRFKGLDSHWGQYRDICCHGAERCSG